MPATPQIQPTNSFKANAAASSVVSGGLPAKPKKKKKKKAKSIAKLLELPANPHDRLTTLHARLHLPRPIYTIIEQKRWRAIVRTDEEGAEIGKKSTKEVIVEEWDKNGAELWSSTQKDAREAAAREACKVLEVRLAEKLLGKGKGTDGAMGEETSAAAARPGHGGEEELEGEFGSEEDKENEEHGSDKDFVLDDSVAEYDDYGLEIVWD